MVSEGLQGAIQANVLTALIFSETACRVVKASVDVSLFTTRAYRDIVTRAYAYIDDYGKPPGSHIADELEDLIQKDDEHGQMVGEVLRQSYELWQSDFNEAYVLTQLERFVQEQALKVGIVKAHELTMRGDIEGASAELTKAMRVRSSSFSSGLNLKQAIKALANPDDHRDTLNLGIEEFDRRHLGAGRQELHLFIGPPKTGKCIEADALVTLPSGERKRIADVVHDKDPEVIALDEVSKKAVKVKVANHWDNGKKECVRLTTYHGRSVVTTANHRYLTPRGWVPLTNLVVNQDFIAVPRSLPGLGVDTTKPHELRLLGYLIADGTLGDPYSLGFTKFPQHVEVLADFMDCVRRFGDQVTHVRQNGYLIVGTPGKVRGWLKELGLMGKPSRDKFIPEFIFKLSDKCIAEFLRGLFSCDLGVCKKQIEFTSSSDRLAQQVNHLLMRLGIGTTYREFTARFKGKELPGYAVVQVVGRENLERFKAKIKLIGKKKEKLDRVHTPDRQKKPYHTEYLSENFVFDKVRSIEAVGKKHTYDLEVEVHHNFIADDVLVHNTQWLTHCTKRALQQRWKVVVLTLELADKFWARRLLQSLFSVKTREDAEIEVAKFMRNAEKQVEGIEMRKWNRPSIDTPDKIRALGNKVERLHINNRLWIKSFPTGSLTVNGINAYLDQLDSVAKFVPDLVVLDYADLMKVDSNNYRIDLGNLYKDLRGVAVERNLAMITASQSNRGGADARLLRSTDVAEDFSKIGTADCVLTYSQTPLEKRRGLARLYVAAGRTEEDKFSVVVSQNYAVGQFAIDSWYMRDEYWTFLGPDQQTGEEE